MKAYRLCIGLLLIATLAAAQPKQINKIKKELKKVTESKEFATGFVGFSLVDTESGKVLVESNSKKSFITASTMKLVTTGAALALLGDTFRFKTELGYKGVIANGVLKGELYISGGADPTTGSDRWPETAIDSICNYFVGELKALGITKIDGRLSVRSKGYLTDNIPPDFVVGDLPNYYGVPPFELNYRENYFDDGIDTLVIPDLMDPDVLHDTIVQRIYFPYKFTNNGIQQLIKPAQLFKDRLERNLGLSGIIIKDDPDEINEGVGLYYIVEGPYKLISTYYSPSLFDIAQKTNESSINLYAECILRAIGIQKYGPSTLDTCLTIAKRFWKSEVGDLTGLRMTDGSGLSRSNLCTPALMTKMLTAYTNRTNFGAFYSTLAVAGKTGTVANFCKGTAADGNARIKSGSMSRVKCFAGYVTGKDGKIYAFTIMFNNFELDANPTAAAQKIVPLIAGLKNGKTKRYLIK